MTKLNLSKLGNFPEYVHKPRIARPLGVIVVPNLALKAYNLTETEEIPNTGWFKKDIQAFLESMVKDRGEWRLDPRSGLGFLIESPDTLNVAIWNSNTSYLPINTVYGIDNGGNIQILTINEGAYCAFEMMIAYHEAKCWLKYLDSDRTERDKRAYLNKRLKKRELR